jgi:hypothetical protein
MTETSNTEKTVALEDLAIILGTDTEAAASFAGSKGPWTSEEAEEIHRIYRNTDPETGVYTEPEAATVAIEGLRDRMLQHKAVKEYAHFLGDEALGALNTVVAKESPVGHGAPFTEAEAQTVIAWMLEDVKMAGDTHGVQVLLAELEGITRTYARLLGTVGIDMGRASKEHGPAAAALVTLSAAEPTAELQMRWSSKSKEVLAAAHVLAGTRLEVPEGQDGAGDLLWVNRRMAGWLVTAFPKDADEAALREDGWEPLYTR